MKIKQKLIGAILTVTMLSGYLSTMISVVKATSINITNQNSKTNHQNVEFNSYFENQAHSSEFKIGKEAKLQISVKVNNAGYLKNGVVTFNNANFEIDSDNLKNENIQNSSKSEITLKQINNQNNATVIEVPITMKESETIDTDFFTKIAKVNFKATYIDENGKEKEIKKEINNQVKWVGEAQAELAGEITKYLSFEENGKKGVLVQAKIRNSIKNNSLPVAKTKLEVTIPEIKISEEKTITPEKITVIANKLEGTTAKKANQFGTENYKYNEQTKKVEIEVTNHEENGQISWKKNAIDEYLVNYIFMGEEAYNFVQTNLKEGNKIEGDITVKTNIETYNAKETIAQKAGKISYSIDSQKGNLLEVAIETEQNISKGYIYANYDKNEETNKKQTNYEVSYIAQVNDSNLLENITLKTTQEKYIDYEGKEHKSNQAIYNKTIKISQDVFNKMLGEDGKIEITDISGKTIAQITKETEKDEDGNYIANIDKLAEIIIKTSKPQTEGNLKITLEKAIDANTRYTKQEMKNFAELELEINAKEYTNKAKINLTEPTNKAEISIGTKTLSTIVENKGVEIRAVLDTSSSKNALFKNPTLQILLPENIEKLNITSTQLLLEDELKIKQTKVVEQDGRKIIQIILEGTQTKYMDNNDAEGQNIIAKGANIVIKADITFKKLSPSANTNIVLYYTNQNSNKYEDINTNSKMKAVGASNDTVAIGIAKDDIQIVSPNGVLTENHMNGYQENESISNLTAEKQEKVIDINKPQKDVQIGGTIINNYENNIENVFILGRIPFAGNKQIDTNTELGSNFTMKMKEKISTSKMDASRIKIYYSTNAEASKDLLNAENAWSENPENLSEVKSYLIAITGEVAKGAELGFNYKVELPANLSYDNKTYTTYKVYYDNKMENATLGETKLAGIIGLTTGAKPDITVEVKSSIDTVREGQIVKMKTLIKNEGTKTVKNTKVNIPVPENATFVQYVDGNGFYEEDGKTKTINVGDIEAGKTKQISYYVKFNDDVFETEQDEETEEVQKTYPKQITHKVTVNVEDNIQITSNEHKFNVYQGKIAIDMNTRTSSNQVLKQGDIINYVINFTNISGEEELTNTVATVKLPQGTKYKKGEIKDNWSSNNGMEQGISYDEKTGNITLNVGTIKTTKMASLDIEIENAEGNIDVMAKAKANGAEEHYSNIIEYTAENIDLQISELTANPKYVKEGQEITYTLKLTNKGNTAVTGIRVSDELPEGLNFVKATYTYAGKEQEITTLKNGRVEIAISQLAGGESTQITVIAKAAMLPNKNDKEITNKMTLIANGYQSMNTNTVTNTIEYYQTIHDQVENENPGTNPSNPSGSGNNTNKPKESYKITGTAWVDKNKDGKRDDEEELLSGIQVILLNKTTSDIVKDKDTGALKEVTTNKNGQYEFTNLAKGEYLVIFLYDAGKYNVTEYQAKTVGESYNSDAINMKITLNGEQRYVGVTDTVKVKDSNIRDIDLGLYIAEKFDLRLDKYISKITANTPTSGTKTYNYNNAKLTKREVYGKDVNNSSLIVEYKIVVTNEGQVAGYAKKIIDYLPEDAKFSTELNKDWYISKNNGEVYNTALANEKIEPGQSKEVTLILTLNITDKNIGTIINNNAEIYESYNEQGIADYDSIEANRLESEDDMSNADIMLSVATGKIVIYVTFALAVMMLLGFGIYEIKRRVLDKKD